MYSENEPTARNSWSYDDGHGEWQRDTPLFIPPVPVHVRKRKREEVRADPRGRPLDAVPIKGGPHTIPLRMPQDAPKPSVPTVSPSVPTPPPLSPYAAMRPLWQQHAEETRAPPPPRSGDPDVEFLQSRGISVADSDRFVHDLLHGGNAELHVELRKRRHKPFFGDVLRYYRVLRKRERDERRPAGSEEKEDDVATDVRESEGEERMRLFDEDLQMMRPPRSRYQEQFHELAKPALVPHIYGKAEYARSYVHILDKLDTDTLPVMILLYIRRRGGKTDGAARLAAACGDVFPDGKKILLMGQNLNISKALLSLVKTYFRQLPDAERRIVRDTNTEFWVFPRNVDPDKAKQQENWRTTTPINKFRVCAGDLRGKKREREGVWEVVGRSLAPRAGRTARAPIGTPLGPPTALFRPRF